MDRTKLKRMVLDLESLVEKKAEVYSDVDLYKSTCTILQDYDEVLDDDDGYPD